MMPFLFITLCVLIFLCVNIHGSQFDAHNLIIMLGLPKSGTTSIHFALSKLSIKSVHFEVNGLRDTLCSNNSFPIKKVDVRGVSNSTEWKEIMHPVDGCYAGVVIQKALANNIRPLEYFVQKGYRAFAQMDVCKPQFGISIWPQIDSLHDIAEAYPSAHFIHTNRISAAVHVESMKAWDHMLDRIHDVGMLHRFPGQSVHKTKVENGIIMIDELHKRTIDYFRNRPNLKFLDVTIEDPYASQNISNFLGLDRFRLEHLNTGHYKNHTSPHF